MGKTLGYGEITVANMTEPFTVMLTNEAQQFATDSNRKVTSAQSYYTDIIVIRGSQERTDYTIGNITSGSGITVSKTNERVTFSVSVGATIGADTGVIEIPITLDGQTVKKQFSWSCGKQGPQGVKGENGSKGKSVQNVIEYYLATSASSDVTSSTNGWSTDPTTQKLTAEKKYLWNCKQTVYDDGTRGSITSPVICGTYGDKGIDGKNATYITVSGTNFDTVTGISKMASYISINGTKYDFMPTRGHTLAIINPSNGAVENIKSYDTYTTTSLLDTPLSEVESDKIICLFTANASGLTQTSRNTLNECGSNLSDIWTPGRKTHVFIGMKGLQKGQAYEIVASGSNATKTVTAYYTNSGIVTNGANGQDGISPKVSISKTGDTTTISIVDATGTHTQTVKDGTNGTPGAAGKDGKTSYFHVKYSNDGGKTFTGNSGEDTGIYMGSYTDYTEADSTDVSKYTWVKVKGDKGDTGQKGDNAKNLTITPSSQYFKSTDGGKTFAPNVITIKPTIQGEINFGKWQFSIDGGVSFTDVVSGQKGLTINNNVLTVSKDSSLYSDAVTMVTFRAVANDSSFYDTCSIAKIYDVSDIEIGGRNLLLNSDKEYVMGFGIPNTTWTDGYAYIELPTTRMYDEILPQNNAFLLHPEAGKTYTQTIWIETDADVIDLNAAQVSWFTGKYGHVLVAAKIIKLADNSYKLTSTYTVTKEDSDIRLFDIMFLFSALDISNSGTYLKFGKLKVEQGNVSTDWTPAPEDVQTAILSTKSEISDVSLKVDKNKQAIEQRVEKTTYQQDLNLVKGDISKANEGLNKWRYEIYPKSLFTSEYQGKSTIDVFAKNTNLTPSQSVLINDTDLSVAWNYAENYIGYALTFAKFSAAKSVAITFAHDDRAHIYLNGKLIGGSDAYNKNGESLTLGFVKGWNCIEVVVNEDANTEGFKLGTTLSALSECQLMNCYYGTPVARQSHITNQLVQNTTDIDGISGSVQQVMSTVGGSGKVDEFVNNYSTWKKKVDDIETRVGKTYVTKNDFNGLEIGGRNLILNSAFKKGRKEWSDWGNPTTREIVSSNGKSWAHIVGNQQNYQGFNQWTPAGSIKEGDHITFSARIKGSAANQRFTVGIHWLNSGNTIISQDWHTFIVDTTENVYTWTVNASGSGCNKLNLMVGVSDPSIVYNVYFTEIMVVKGNKATDWTPAPEDNEINGQNLVSNLPSNWEQGSFDGSRVDVGGTYSTGKVDNSTIIRVKELVPVSGSITISNAYSNQSKKPIQHYIVAFDVDKKYLGSSYVSTAWNDFPRIVDMKDAKYIAVIVRYKDESAITPSDISQICLKIERGTSATPFTLAPEDVNGKIVNVETIANQTAKKFEWIVKGGDSSSNFTLTDRVADLVAERINFKGLVTFSGLNTDAKNEIGKVAQSKVDGLEVGGRNLLKHSSMIGEKLVCDNYVGCNNCDTKEYTNEGFHIITPTEGNANNGIAFSFDNFTILGINGGDTITFSCDIKGTSDSHAPFISIHISDNNWYGSDVIQKNTSVSISSSWQRVSVTITTPTGLSKNHMWLAIHGNYQSDLYVRNFKLEKGNKATDWMPAPEDVSQDASNKANQALTDAKNYSSNAVNWVTNNGSSTTSLNSMVKKWTDGAVSDTTKINGGWIKANTITASKIALADFTNYSQLTRDTAATYGFAVTDDTDGTWFSTQGIRQDQFISEIFPCNGGESYLIEYDISTNAKGANNSTDTKNYIGVAIGVYGYTGTVGSNGLPNKATNIWYADRITGSETAPSIHVKTTITTSTATKQFRIFLQSKGYYFEGTTKIRNLSVRRMYGGTLIVDGSITADKIATDAIKSRNYISSGGTQGSFLNLSDGSFQSPNLSWDANGNLIAKNVNLSGQITATKGSIGGWSVDNYSIYTTYDSDQNIFGSGISGTKGKYVLWAGETNNAIGANRSSDTPTDASLVIYNNGGLEVRKTMVGNDKKNHLYTTILQSGQINLKMDDNYIGTITATDTISSNSTVTMSHVSMAAKKGYGWSILHTDDSGNLISDIQRDPGDTKIKIRSPITVSSTDITKYNAIETTGDVVVNGKIHANYGPNRIQFNPDNNGSIELYGGMPFIDFHFACSNADYTSRIISQHDWDCLTFTGSILLGGTIYNSSGGHYTWDGKDDAYISCADYNGHNIYYYANYHAFYVNNDSGSGMMYINTNGVTSRVGFTKTSDERIKKNFESFDDNIIDAYMNIEPVKYQLKQSSNDNYHFGFKAQHVDKVFSDYGDTYNESFDICTSRPIDPDKAKELYGVDDMTEEYGLRYDELIAPTTYMVQHIYKELESTKGELAKVKQEKTDLETRLQAIEAKLGL